MARKKIVSPGLTEKTYQWYENIFDNVNQGAMFALESYPELYGRTLRDLRGIFGMGELSLIIDVQNGCFLMPQIVGQHLLPNVEDGITLEGMAEKWKVDRNVFLDKLKKLHLFEIAILEIWAQAFWAQENHDLVRWVSGLVSNK